MNAAALRAGVVAIGLLVAWRIVQVNLVLYDATGFPRLPARTAASTTGHSALQDVLADNPGHVGALLRLAGAHEAAGNAHEARRAYAAAFALAPMDREVLGAGADYFLRMGATAEAIGALDRLVEAYPDAREIAFPVLARLLVSGEQGAAWARIAARRPEWMGSFITSSCAKGVDPAFLVPLLLDRLAQGRTRAEEAGCVIDKLRDSDRWEQAYQVWLNTLPRERMNDVGFIYNGSFEHAASGLGFDWRPTHARERDVGHSVEMAQALGVAGKRALRVSYNGKRQAGTPILQYLALAPGRYRVSGLAHPQSITAGRGVQWTVRCVSAGQQRAVLAASERFVGSSEWRPFTFEFAIAPDCPGQVLQLELAGAADGAMYLSGLAWFDELVLRRLG
jgi:hypothetical protein